MRNEITSIGQKQNCSGISLSTDGDDDYAKQPDNTFKAVCSRMCPLMREFLHTHVTPCTQTLLPTYTAFQRTRILVNYTIYLNILYAIRLGYQITHIPTIRRAEALEMTSHMFDSLTRHIHDISGVIAMVPPMEGEKHARYSACYARKDFYDEKNDAILHSIAQKRRLIINCNFIHAVLRKW
ncbi:hypothetical protein G5I_01996 [Acromyrmex echinatior]|uniref:Uncharacterized protein n=1 Tax=Acromyrmex echinatior TaxID=103372 RepID=F4W949_ACREC|nr:hypothetical protein G5I_01996 [Acromyrmex echinatior]